MIERATRPRVLFLAALAVQPALFPLPAIPWALLVRPLPVLVLAAHVARAVQLRRSWPVALGLALGGAGGVAEEQLGQRDIKTTPRHAVRGRRRLRARSIARPPR